MNYNNYFQFFNQAITQNLISEKIQISPVFKGKSLKKNEYSKRIQEIQYYICPIELENKKTLLICDLPINFLISHTILIGEDVELYEFEYKEKQFIAIENIVQLFNENEIKNKTKITSKELYNLKFEYEFKQPEIIQELKSYLTQYKKINFNKIHIIPQNNAENFVPTAKATHLKLAKDMKLPITNLIINNFIRNTNINIYDNNQLKKILNPSFVVSKKAQINFCNTNKLVLYNDISTNIYLDYNIKTIINKIKNAKFINFNKEHIINQVLNKKKIKLNSYNITEYLPLWKSIKKQSYLQIKDIKDFEELTGMTFKNTTKNFDKIYMQFSNTDKAIFKNQYLNNNLVDTFNNLEIQEKIEFTRIEELIIKIMFNANQEINTIHNFEKYDINLTKKIINNTNYILNFLIKKTIQYNKLPNKNKNKNEDILELYLINISYLITKNKNNYSNYLDKKKLINSLFNITSNLKSFVKTLDTNYDNLYSMLKIIHRIISTIENIDNTIIEELKNNYNEYFNNYNFSFAKQPEIDQSAINIINDIIKTKKLINKHDNIKIYLKKTSIIEKYFDSKSIIKNEPTYQEYIKPNNFILRNIFKYNYEDISEQISNLNTQAIKSSNLNFNKSQIKIKDEYYSIYHKYKDYKTIISNDIFNILLGFE